jgi:hypothetical protein
VLWITVLLVNYLSTNMLRLARFGADVATRSFDFGRALLLCLLTNPIAGMALAQGAGAASRSTWLHNGSTVYLVANGTSREFYYQAPSDGMKAAGAHEGTLLFNGKSVNAQYIGTAYIFSRRCGPVPYQVVGPILDNYERVLLQGQAPRVGPDCKPLSFVAETLEFKLVNPSPDQSAGAQPSLPDAFTGVWLQANPERSACKAVTWDARDRDTVQMIKTADQSLMGWEFACKLGSTKRPGGGSRQDTESIVVELSCGGEGGVTWSSTEQWTVQATSSRKILTMTPLKVWNIRDNAGRAIRDPSLSNKTPAEFLECN